MPEAWPCGGVWGGELMLAHLAASARATGLEWRRGSHLSVIPKEDGTPPRLPVSRIGGLAHSGMVPWLSSERNFERGRKPLRFPVSRIGGLARSGMLPWLTSERSSKRGREPLRLSVFQAGGFARSGMPPWLSSERNSERGRKPLGLPFTRIGNRKCVRKRLRHRRA